MSRPVEVVRRLVRSAYYCIIATSQQKVLSEGGLITASKTYLKSAIVVVDMLIDKIPAREAVEIIEMLDKIDRCVYDKSYRFPKNKVVEKKLRKVREEARRLRRKIANRMV